ncbi:MAG: isochorismatase family cysteine hydrolase [bacterium]
MTKSIESLTARLKKKLVQPDPAMAVILIDMQKNFVKKLKPEDKDRIIPKQIAIIRLCADKDIPLFVLEYKNEYEKNGKTIPELKKEIAKVPRAEYIIKHENDGFSEFRLRCWLESYGITKLLLLGINADYCVKQTAESAIRLGYQIITSRDFIGGQSDHSNDNSADWYKNNGLFLPTAEAVVKKLNLQTAVA